MLSSAKQQQGVTLTELMVGLVVGLIVIAGVLQVYLTTINTSGDTLKMSHLNQELAAIINIMSNDIRRAGYAGMTDGSGDYYDWDDPLGNDPDDYHNYLEPHTNPFNQRGSSALEVHDNGGGAYADAGALGSGSCIVYAYDANSDGQVDSSESLGFRLNAAGDEVQMRTSGTVTNDCTNANGTWEGVSDAETVTITELSFDLSESMCLNSSEPNDVDDDGANGVDDAAEFDCYDIAADSDEVTVEVRNVAITLSGQLADDASVRASLTQSVRVRNNLIAVTP